MPTVPTRTAFAVLDDGASNARVQQQQLRSLPASSGIDAPELVTPKVQGGDFVTSRLATNLTPGVTPSLAAIPGQQLQDVSQTMRGASAEAADISLRVQNQTNALMVDNAENQAKEVAMRLAYDKDGGFTTLRGYDALNRPDGKPLSVEYTGKFDQAVDQIAGGLKNDAQRLVFNARVADLRNQFQQQAVQHETLQFRDYNLSTQEGTIKTSIDEIGANYTNPEATQKATTRLLSAVYEQGQALGKSAEWIAAEQKDMLSKAHTVAIGAALQSDNIAFADAYLKQHSDEMTASDLLQVKGIVNKEVDSKFAVAAAADAIGSVAPKFNTGDFDRMVAITAQSESGNRDFNPDGTPVTSPKGARGRMQVMPATAANPGYGIAPSDGTPDGDARVGQQKLAALVQRYHGDVAQAWGAYNWGEANVDKAIAQGQKDGQPWLNYAPAETKKYVTQNLAALGSGGGRTAQPTELDALNAVRADPRVNQSPTRLALAEAETRRRWAEVEADRKAKAEDVTAQALRAVEANGGDYLGLPVSLRAAIPAEKLETVMDFAKKVASGPDQSNLAVYQKLTSDPAYLNGLTDQQMYALRPQLSASDFKHFVDQRAKTQSSDQGPGALNTQAINYTMGNRLRSLGINPNPNPDKDQKEAERVGAVNKFVNDSILVAQAQQGKKFNDAEVAAHIDDLFNRNVEFKNQVFGIPLPGSTGRRMLETTVNDIPSNDVRAIKQAFAARGNNNPTDADVLGAWFRGQRAN